MLAFRCNVIIVVLETRLLNVLIYHTFDLHEVVTRRNLCKQGRTEIGIHEISWLNVSDLLGNV
jgi:hypothetical protein